MQGSKAAGRPNNQQERGAERKPGREIAVVGRKISKKKKKGQPGENNRWGEK